MYHTLALLAVFANAQLADKSERFDRDPGWEGVNNRVVPKRIPTISQDFGFSSTSFAGKQMGEIGGRLWRSTTPAYYGEKIAAKTLNVKLSASGTFALTSVNSGSGMFFGWFNSQQPGGGRPINSLGLHIDGEKTGGRLAIMLIGATNKTCGKFVTPFVPGKFRPTPIKADGTKYTWKLTYDPEANDGMGRFQFTIKSTSAKPEEFEGKLLTVDLPAGFKKDGASFDRFGLMNIMKSGNTLNIYFADLERDGRNLDLSKDPSWDGAGNRITFQDKELAGAHDFGYSAKTNFAGGKLGEVGGAFWRSEKTFGSYADRISALALDDRLTASGKAFLKVGAPDSDMFFGWFNSAAKDKSPAQASHFLGIHVGGPTRVGHYFLPTYATAKGTRGTLKKGPVIVPGKVYEWRLQYDPAANDGKGAIQVTLGDESATLNLKAGQKAEGSRFDRFGFFTASAGGSVVKIYFDDLTYTASRKDASR